MVIVQMKMCLDAKLKMCFTVFVMSVNHYNTLIHVILLSVVIMKLSLHPNKMYQFKSTSLILC